jgi:hypothetical protein
MSGGTDIHVWLRGALLNNRNLQSFAHGLLFSQSVRVESAHHAGRL